MTIFMNVGMASNDFLLRHTLFHVHFRHLQANRQTAAQHAEIMRKLETLNLLTDSNKLLRDERDKLGHQLREAETRVSVILHKALIIYLHIW